MNVYDRWGNHIFTQNGKNAAWDGTSLKGINSQQDVYTWQITFKDLRDGEVKVISGDVLLLR